MLRPPPRQGSSRRGKRHHGRPATASPHLAPAPAAPPDLPPTATTLPAFLPGHRRFTGNGARQGASTAPTPVQAIDDGAPRYHLDIETDDLAAEVARLTALGAEQVSRWKDAFTMRTPGGHMLCVIPVHSDPETFASSARTWP